jgi:hypothetical protein
MFGFGSNAKKLDKASSLALAIMMPKLGGRLRDGMLMELQRDPYIAGYILGQLDSFDGFFELRLGLSESDRKIVRARVFEAIYGKDLQNVQHAIGALNVHARARTPQFQDGASKGFRLVAYSVGAKDIRDDPEYESALRNSEVLGEQMANLYQRPSFPTDNPSDLHTAAILGLEELWFWSHRPL